MTTDELVKLQSEIKVLNDDFNAYYADWKGAKVRFINLTKTLTSSATSPVHIEVTQAEASAQQTEEHASTADENQAADETKSTRADDCIPAADETARATTSVVPEELVRPVEASTAVPEETDHARATASVVPKENEPISSAPPTQTTSPTPPSASEVKKTKAAERAAVKKRKASAASDSSAPKKMKPMTSSLQIRLMLFPSQPGHQRTLFLLMKNI